MVRGQLSLSRCLLRQHSLRGRLVGNTEANSLVQQAQLKKLNGVWELGLSSASVDLSQHMVLVLGPPAQPGVGLGNGVQQSHF